MAKYQDDVYDHLKSDIDKIRVRFRQYISYSNEQGAKSVVDEIIYNALDECKNPRSPGDTIHIVMDDGDPYVWAADKNDKIEKRKVELGEYDENLMRYEILSGISEEDRIAFPDSYIKEGMKVTENYEDVMNQDMNGGDGEDIDGDMLVPRDDNFDDMLIPEDGNIDLENGEMIDFDSMDGGALPEGDVDLDVNDGETPEADTSEPEEER